MKTNLKTMLVEYGDVNTMVKTKTGKLVKRALSLHGLPAELVAEHDLVLYVSKTGKITGVMKNRYGPVTMGGKP